MKKTRNSAISPKHSSKSRRSSLGSLSVLLWSLNGSRLNLNRETQNLPLCTACRHKLFFCKSKVIKKPRIQNHPPFGLQAIDLSVLTRGSLTFGNTVPSRASMKVGSEWKQQQFPGASASVVRVKQSTGKRRHSPASLHQLAELPNNQATPPLFKAREWILQNRNLRPLVKLKHSALDVFPLVSFSSSLTFCRLLGSVFKCFAFLQKKKKKITSTSS